MMYVHPVQSGSTKTCTKCGTDKPLDQFNLLRGKPRAYCKTCHSASALAWSRSNRERRREIANAHTKRRREKLGPPKKSGRAAIYSAAERVLKMREWRKKWGDSNKHAVLAKTRRYQANKIKSVPKWADHEAIERIYERAKSMGMHVDHIVPLQSPVVCGLHCEANLQLLPPEENWSKHNKHWPDMP